MELFHFHLVIFCTSRLERKYNYMIHSGGLAVIIIGYVIMESELQLGGDSYKNTT